MARTRESTYAANTSVRKVAATNSATVSNVDNTISPAALTTLDIHYEDLDTDRKIVYVCFSVTACFTIASFLYIAVACSMLEQSGLVARSLAISPMTDGNFDDVVRHWYFDDKEFSQVRD